MHANPIVDDRGDGRGVRLADRSARAEAGREEGARQGAAAGPAVNPKLEQYKKEAAADVDSMRELSQQMNDMVFSFGELGFQEFETSKYLTGILEKNGFTVERGIAGIPTAWVASWGSGKPVIALGSDVDCIPQASQKPGVAYHDPIIEGAPGHGEGHNSGTPMNITAAIAVKKIMEREHLPGTHQGVARHRRGARRHQGLLRPRRRLQGRRRGALRARRRPVRRGLGRQHGQRPRVGRVRLQGRERARRRRAVARPLGARRGRAVRRRLELPPRAPAHPAAVAQRDPERRRPAQRRAAHRERSGTTSAKSTTRTSRSCGRSATTWPRARRS